MHITVVGELAEYGRPIMLEAGRGLVQLGIELPLRYMQMMQPGPDDDEVAAKRRHHPRAVVEMTDSDDSDDDPPSSLTHQMRKEI